MSSESCLNFVSWSRRGSISCTLLPDIGMEFSSEKSSPTPQQIALDGNQSSAAPLRDTLSYWNDKVFGRVTTETMSFRNKNNPLYSTKLDAKVGKFSWCIESEIWGARVVQKPWSISKKISIDHRRCWCICSQSRSKIRIKHVTAALSFFSFLSIRFI